MVDGMIWCIVPLGVWVYQKEVSGNLMQVSKGWKNIKDVGKVNLKVWLEFWVWKMTF